LGRPALAKKFLQENDFYQDYVDRAETFLDILKTDINKRFSRVGEFLKSSSGQEGAENALHAISIWRGLIRDFLLLICGHNDLIQFEVIKEKVELGSKNFNFGEVLRIIKLLETGELQIRSNVNPKLVLENTLANI
jgi:DNA polymerase III gamma/tau subunit